MKPQFLSACALVLCLTVPVFAEDRGKLIFEDDFERNESQEIKDEIGKGWGPKRRTRVAGNKQFKWKNGEQ